MALLMPVVRAMPIVAVRELVMRCQRAVPVRIIVATVPSALNMRPATMETYRITMVTWRRVNWLSAVMDSRVRPSAGEAGYELCDDGGESEICRDDCTVELRRRFYESDRRGGV